MRADMVAGAVFPDYDLTDHTGKRRKLSELPGPMIPHVIVLQPGLVIFKIYNGYWFFGRPTVEELRQDLRAANMIASIPTARPTDRSFESRIRVSPDASRT